MKREKWTPTASSYLCGEHFLETDYTHPSLLPHSTSLGKKYLKKDAVPSVFKFPEHLQKRPVKERNPKKREFQAQHLRSDTVAIPAKNPRLDDHTYASSVSPRKLKTMYKAKIKKKNQIIQNLRRKNIRKEKTIKGLILKLKQAKMLSEESGSSIISNFGHMTTEIFKNEAKNKDHSSGSRYSDEIKEFAISLNFYSPRAYRFLRKSLCLPHPSTLRAWSASIECEPGFLKKPLLHIADLVKDGQSDCIIIIDEMSIKKEVKWDPKNEKFVGTVDYGSIKAEETDTIATNALVIMISGLKKPWYVPLGYFLTNKLNGDILCQLINESIKMLSEVGCFVHAVVFDGAPKNIGMAEKLGCNIKKLEGSFPHPCQIGKKIYVIFDVCHMLKLARNAFSDIKIFCTPTGERIPWEYVLALYRAQQKDILHLGNKLKTKHVKWQNNKMKVSVAAQTYSHSVSAAITFLRNLKLKEFKDSKATSDFILLMNNLFDMLNSKSKFGKHTKKPIDLNNFYDIESSFKDGTEFLKSLKDTAGVPLIKGPRKAFVIGFYVSALSVISYDFSIRTFRQKVLETHKRRLTSN